MRLVNIALSLLAGTAVLKHRLVKINATTGVADYAGITDDPIGVSMDDVDAGEAQGVRMFGVGNQLVTANAAITRGARVYTAASGKVGPSASTAKAIGIALEAAAADGDVIAIAPLATSGAVVP